MACKNCLVMAFQFEILVQGTQNVSLMDIVMDHFSRRGLMMIKKEDLLMIQESEAREFLDISREDCDG